MVWHLCWLSARGDYEQCRDLVQEVSLALWLHFDMLRPEASQQEERAWVRWQTRSVLDLKRRMRRPFLFRLTDKMSKTLVADDSIERQEQLDYIMASLSPDDQRILRLRMEGYRADEIASILGLNRDAVYQRMRRVVLKARRVMLVMLMLLVTSTLAVAVVPQWRKAVFGNPKPAVGDIPTDSVATPPAKTAPCDNIHPCEECGVGCRSERQQVDHLPASDAQVVVSRLNSLCDTIPAVVDPLPTVPTISVTDNHIVVSGIYGERVTVRRMNGTLLSSQDCNGFCIFTIFPDCEYFYAQNSYEIQIGSRPVLVLEL